MKYRSQKKTQQKSTTKRKSHRRTYRGGAVEVKPFEMLGYPHGASSASQAALLNAQNKDAAQFKMNKIGGKGEDTDATKTTDEPVDVLEVPQFPALGGVKTAYNSTDASITGNLTSVIGDVNATNDHFARVGGSRSRSRSKSKHKHKHSRSKQSKHKQSKHKQSKYKHKHSKYCKCSQRRS
jgi:hypothetical protein